MMYNIYTVLNTNYMKFGKIFLKSLYNTQDMSKIDTIYILDTGLLEEDIKFINKFDKIKIIEATEGLNVQKEGKKWTNIVCSKTYYLKKLIEEKVNICPIIMIDTDCLFLKDISNLIDTKFDFQVCKRGNNNKPLLASFMIFNKKDISLQLLDEWLNEIPKINRDWKETKALINIYKKKKSPYKFDLVPLNIVSALRKKQINKNTRIIHFKSSSNQNSKIKFKARTNRRGLKKYVEEYV